MQKRPHREGEREGDVGGGERETVRARGEASRDRHPCEWLMELAAFAE